MTGLQVRQISRIPQPTCPSLVQLYQNTAVSLCGPQFSGRFIRVQPYVDDGSACAIGYVQIHDYVLSHLYVDGHLQAWR